MDTPNTVFVITHTMRYDGSTIRGTRLSPEEAVTLAEKFIAGERLAYVDGETETGDLDGGGQEIRRWYTKSGDEWVTIVAYPTA